VAVVQPKYYAMVEATIPRI